MQTMTSRITLSALAVALLAAGGGTAQEGWKEFTWKEGKCSLLLPGKPTEKKDSLQVADKQGVYMVYFADSPAMAKADAATIKQVFDKARDALVESLKGKLLSEKEVTLGKHKGRELQIEAPKIGVYRTRLFQIGERYYQIILTAPKEVATSKEADKFFGSFKVLP
jgi:hypothetical protein